MNEMYGFHVVIYSILYVIIWMIKGGMKVEETIVKAIQDEYPDDFAWCYGCGRLNKDGHHLRTSWQGSWRWSGTSKIRHSFFESGILETDTTGSAP